MGPYSSYDIPHGMIMIAAAFSIVVLVFLVLLSTHLYRCLQAQDSELVEGAKANIRGDVLDVIKRAILWVIGYRGEDREKISVADVDVAWVSRYRVSIFFRLLPVYAVYILALVVLTRPIFDAGNGFEIFTYSENLHELFALLVIYVCSNIIFDYFSLRYSLANVMDAKKTGRYVFYFLKDAGIATALFLMSQAVSCVLWVLKRENSGFPKFDDGLLNQFVEITLWPYAFVSGEGSSTIVSDPFPGQLLITGTVYVPTITLGIMFLVFTVFLALARAVKGFLISKQLDRICRLFLKVHLVGMFNPDAIGNRFRYCNYAFLALLNIGFITTISILASRSFGS